MINKQTVALLIIVLASFAAVAHADTPFILCTADALPIAKMAGLEGNYVASTTQIPSGSDVLLIGSIFSSPDNAPLFDLQQKKCRIVRLESHLTPVLISRIKAYIRYSGSGKSAFADPEEGMRYILYANLTSEIENFTSSMQAGNKQTNIDGRPQPIFAGAPSTRPAYMSPLRSRLNQTGKVDCEVNFAENSAELSADADLILLEIAKMLQSDPAIKITITGHTDYGYNTAAFNLELSRQRAENVKNWLVGKGIDASRIATNGAGDTKPLVVDNTQSHRPKNRRIEITRN